jgi:Uracil DNA glycosylase superfamily
MPRIFEPELRRALAARIRYYNEMGIYDFYRRETPGEVATVAADVAVSDTAAVPIQPESGEEMSSRKAAAVAAPVAVEENIFEVLAPKPEQGISDPVKALKIIREDLGDCTRCPLHKQGRKQIVFGVGNAKAELMFVGEGPGADEDEQGEPFVGRAGQSAGVHREHCEVPAPGESHAGARGVRNLLSVPDAPDRGNQAKGRRGAGRRGGQDAARYERLDGAAARAILRLQTGGRPQQRS